FKCAVQTATSCAYSSSSFGVRSLVPSLRKKADTFKAMKTGIATVSGTSLYYETMGEGFPLIFVSGGGVMDRRAWDGQFPIQVVDLPLRGYVYSALTAKHGSMVQARRAGR